MEHQRFQPPVLVSAAVNFNLNTIKTMLECVHVFESAANLSGRNSVFLCSSCSMHFY